MSNPKERSVKLICECCRQTVETKTFMPTRRQMKKAQTKSDRCVHTQHCCVQHGCKYGHADCPVATRQKVQSYPCEYCNWDLNQKDVKVFRGY